MTLPGFTGSWIEKDTHRSSHQALTQSRAKIKVRSTFKVNRFFPAREEDSSGPFVANSGVFPWAEIAQALWAAVRFNTLTAPSLLCLTCSLHSDALWVCWNRSWEHLCMTLPKWNCFRIFCLPNCLSSLKYLLDSGGSCPRAAMSSEVLTHGSGQEKDKGF